MNDLKKCPFCGSVEIGSIISTTRNGYIVGCASCGATVKALTEGNAHEKWNSRPDGWVKVEDFETLIETVKFFKEFVENANLTDQFDIEEGRQLVLRAIKVLPTAPEEE